MINQSKKLSKEFISKYLNLKYKLDKYIYAYLIQLENRLSIYFLRHKNLNMDDQLFIKKEIKKIHDYKKKLRIYRFIKYRKINNSILDNIIEKIIENDYENIKIDNTIFIEQLNDLSIDSNKKNLFQYYFNGKYYKFLINFIDGLSILSQFTINKIFLVFHIININQQHEIGYNIRVREFKKEVPDVIQLFHEYHNDNKFIKYEMIENDKVLLLDKTIKNILDEDNLLFINYSSEKIDEIYKMILIYIKIEIFINDLNDEKIENFFTMFACIYKISLSKIQSFISSKIIINKDLIDKDLIDNPTEQIPIPLISNDISNAMNSIFPVLFNDNIMDDSLEFILQ